MHQTQVRTMLLHHDSENCVCLKPYSQQDKKTGSHIQIPQVHKLQAGRGAPVCVVYVRTEKKHFEGQYVHTSAACTWKAVVRDLSLLSATRAVTHNTGHKLETHRIFPRRLCGGQVSTAQYNLCYWPVHRNTETFFKEANETESM